MFEYIIFILSMSISVICISYSLYAIGVGWTVGEILSKDDSIVKIVSFINGIWILIKTFLMFNWWTPIIIFLVGWALGFILIIIFKQKVQWIGIIGICPAFILTTII